MSEDAPARLLQEACLKSLGRIKDEVHELFNKYETENLSVDQTLKVLFAYLADRTNAVSTIASWRYIWDAEIVLRSFYETAAKILLISSAKIDDKPKLVDEFWNLLGSVDDRRTSRKALFAEQVFQADSVSASIFVALQDDRFAASEAESTKAQRKRLEQKWSFSEIIETLDRRVELAKSLKGVKALLHIYGMASHLAHADQAAMGLIMDRATRPAEERKIIEVAHFARIMTDQVSISWLCADMIRQHYGVEFADPVAMRRCFEEPTELSRPLQEAFEESQRKFYDEWFGSSDSRPAS